MRPMLAICALVLALAGPVPRLAASTRTHQTSSVAVPLQIIALVNAERQAAGVRPLTLHPILMAEAQRFSRVQAGLGTLSHRGDDNTTAGQRLTRAGYRWRFYGENLAAGQPTPERVVAAWMKSPAHRANVLSPKATEIGIGHTALAGDPSRYDAYYVMEIARPR